MAKKRTPDSKRSSKEAIQRREALKRLGALAITAPTLASIACDDAPADMGTYQNGAEPGVPGNPGGSDGGTLDAGTASTGGGTAGGGGTQGGGTQGGGTQGGSTGGTSGGGASASDAGMSSATEAGMSDAGPTSAGFLPPNFATAPTCTVTPTDPAGEGPFFIHEDEVMTDPSIVRVDMREGRPGVELQLNFRLLDLDMDGECMAPIEGVEVYAWHTDALGLYSGFACQNPDKAYVPGPTVPANNERFCRGVQITNANGVASFRSIYPGWYYGRYIHIHFVALRKGSGASNNGMDPSYRSAKYHIFTTQMYFDETFSRNIHENNAPYMTRTNKEGYSTYVKADPQSGVRPQVRMEGNIVVASLNIITSSKQSRGAGGGFGGFLGGLDANDCPST